MFIINDIEMYWRPEFFLLRYNCFTMQCQFMLYNKVNQLYVYIYPISWIFPPTSHPSRSPQSTKLSSLRYTAGSHQLSVFHMVVYIYQSLSPNKSHPPFPHPPCPHVLSLCRNRDADVKTQKFLSLVSFLFQSKQSCKMPSRVINFDDL